MKKFFILLFVVLLAFILSHRQRMFLRDPMAKVTRNGVVETGTQVYINYSNDVLLEHDGPPMYVTLIQAKNLPEVGAPQSMKCMHWMACLTDADQATLVQPTYKVTPTQMTSKVVTYKDSDGRDVQITLR